MSLDLRHIESFVAVADTRSFSSAAERTGTVQSAVSAHIRLLEQRLSRKLVERGRGKPVSLTHDGNAFLIKARRLWYWPMKPWKDPQSVEQLRPSGLAPQ